MAEKQGMNFEEFERRYKRKMEALGYVFGENPEEDAVLRDQMSGVYMGLGIYSDYQNEVMKAEFERQQQEQLEQLKKQSSIILPGNGGLN